MSPLTTTLNGTDSMAGVHAELHNAADAAINALQAIVPPTLTSGQLLVGSGTATLTQDAGLAWDNTTKTLTATKIVGTLQTASQPNLVVAQSQVTGLAASLAASIPESQISNLTTDLAARAPVSTTVTLTGNQTLTNKTLTAPHLTGAVVDSGGLTLTAVAGNTLGVGVSASAVAGIDIAAGAATDPTNRYGIRVGAPSGASGENLGIKNLGKTYLETIGAGIGFGIIPPSGGFAINGGVLGARTATCKYMLWDSTTGQVCFSATGPAS